MKGKSHAAMGRVLLRTYLPGIAPGKARLFLIGCIQPDRNPATYLKGSLRNQWMRGHNYGNASRFMMRLAMRLDGKRDYSPWDYYCLGKLIHYTMDAFTYAHDGRFSTDLRAHRQYESALQSHFLAQLRCRPVPTCRYQGTPAALIHQLHVAYAREPGCIETDTEYAFRACCLLTQRLTAGLNCNPTNGEISPVIPLVWAGK